MVTGDGSPLLMRLCAQYHTTKRPKVLCFMVDFCFAIPVDKLGVVKELHVYVFHCLLAFSATFIARFKAKLMLCMVLLQRENTSLPKN